MMKYNQVSEFVDGVAVATHRNETGNLTWGLIDKDNNPVSEFKYNYVERWGEGYYKCEIGARKNILRNDGSEVLKVWFNDVFKVKKGLFIFSNTIRKTKEHPTLYMHGLASVNGDILVPPIFNRLMWHDEVVLDFFYAEIDKKPYLITKSGSIIDPAGDHLPKPSEGEDNFEWNGPQKTVCDGCIFTDGINGKGEGCRKLQKEEFRNNVIKGSCDHFKRNEQDLSRQEEREQYKEKQKKDEESKIADEYAVNLLKDFIRDKLDGDILRLTSFDFHDLRDDKKYGNCGGYAFCPEKTSIMKAIMALAFKEVWPGISYNGLEHYDYEADMVNTYLMILGFPLGDNFKGLRNFRPDAALLDRCWAFYRLCHTIGNYAVWPGGLYLCREKLRRSQRYIDTYLQALQHAFLNPTKGNSDLVKAIHGKQMIYSIYEGKEGFAKMCRKLLLGDYIDYMGNPIQMFYGVWSDQKDLTRENYFKAIEQYFDFCEEEIVKRSKLIAERLMAALEMNSTVAENEVLTIQLPEKYEALAALPDDPEGAQSYGKDTSGAVCFVQTYPIKEEKVMPMNDNLSIIAGIHESLGERQGLIEVINGMTRYNKRYVYSIVKSGRIPSGMNYILTMHLVKSGLALCVKGLFEERGTTGVRDATVYEYARRENLVTEVGKGWFKDPYDETFTNGLVMNLAEDRKYDHSFPKHPLSEMRKLIEYIIENN